MYIVCDRDLGFGSGGGGSLAGRVARLLFGLPLLLRHPLFLRV